MKKLLCLLIFVFWVFPVQAVTLEGRVTYTVEQAREEAFKDVEWEIPKKMLLKHRKDPNYSVHIVAKKYSQNVLTDRYITFFSEGTYAYYYFDSPEYGYYYDERGRLTNIRKGFSYTYPYKDYKYDLKGKLVSVSLNISGDESYMFLPNGEFLIHWKGKIGYDKDGNEINKRW